MRPSEGGHDTKGKILDVAGRGPHFVVKLKKEPKPKNNLHLRPNPLNDRKDIRSYHLYTRKAGFERDPHR